MHSTLSSFIKAVERMRIDRKTDDRQLLKCPFSSSYILRRPKTNSRSSSFIRLMRESASRWLSFTDSPIFPSTATVTAHNKHKSDDIASSSLDAISFVQIHWGGQVFPVVKNVFFKIFQRFPCFCVTRFLWYISFWVAVGSLCWQTSTRFTSKRTAWIELHFCITASKITCTWLCTYRLHIRIE